MTTEQAVEEYLRRKRGEQQIPAAGPYEPVDTLSTEDAVEEYMRRRRAAPPPTLFVPPSRQPDLQQVATQQPPRRRQPTPPVAGETDPRWASRGRRGGLGASMAKVGGGMIEALGHVAESYERGGRPTSEVLAEMGVRAAAPSLLKPGDLLQAAYKSATEKILPEAERGRIGRFLLGGEPPEEERRGPRVGPALQRTGRAIREDPRFAEVSEAEVGEVGGFDVEGGAQWDIDWLIQRGAGQLVQFGVQLAVLKATKGRSAPAQFAAFAAPTVIQEGGGAIGETKAKLASRVARGELTQEEADAIAEGVGTVVGLGAFVLERIPYAGVLLKKNKAAQRVFQNAMLRGVQRLGARLTGETAETMVGRMAGRAVGGFTSEGAEELGQEAWSDVVAYLSRTDPQAFRDWQKRYGEAGALGGLIGGPAAVVTGTREDIAQKRQQQSLAQQLERIAKLDEEIQNRVAAGEDKPKVISEVYAREGFPPALAMAAIEEAVGQEAVEAVAAAPVTPEPVVPEAPPAAPAAPTIATEPVPPLPVPPAPSSPAEAIPVPSEPVAVSPLDEALAELPEIPAPAATPAETVPDIRALSNDPERPTGTVTVYRGGKGSGVNPGQWVATSREYAQKFAESEGGQVFEIQVPADHVIWLGKSAGVYTPPGTEHISATTRTGTNDSYPTLADLARRQGSASPPAAPPTEVPAAAPTLWKPGDPLPTTRQDVQKAIEAIATSDLSTKEEQRRLKILRVERDRLKTEERTAEAEAKKKAQQWNPVEKPYVVETQYENNLPAGSGGPYGFRTQQFATEKEARVVLAESLGRGEIRRTLKLAQNPEQWAKKGSWKELDKKTRSRPAKGAAVPAPPVTPIRESVAHRGYLIRYNPIGQEWWIEKDRQRISSATSEQDARATIDQLTAPAEPAVAEVAAVPAPAPAPAPVGEDIFFGLTEDEYNALGEQVEQELKTPAPKWKRLQDGTHEAVVEGRTVTLTKEGTGEDAYWEAAIDGVADPNAFETLAEAKSGIRDGLREELVTAEIKRRAEARRPAAPAAAAKPAPKKGRRPKGEKAAPAVPSLVEAATAPTKPATKPAPAAAAPKLPQGLAGAKPRYGYQQKNFEPEFESDVDKALFIVTQKEKSKSHDKYVAWLQTVFPGATEADLRSRGAEVRARIKPLAAAAKAGEGLRVSAAKPAAPAPSRPLARQTLPTREEALDLARQTYERGHPEAAMVRVRRFMDGYDDAVAGKDRKVKEAGPYTDAYNMVRRAIRQQEEGGQAASETEFVAEEGEGFHARVLYHGTTRAFDEFSTEAKPSERGPRLSGAGIYLTENPEWASQHAQGEGGHVRPVRIRGEIVDAYSKPTPALARRVMGAYQQALATELKKVRARATPEYLAHLERRGAETVLSRASDPLQFDSWHAWLAANMGQAEPLLGAAHVVLERPGVETVVYNPADVRSMYVRASEAPYVAEELGQEATAAAFAPTEDLEVTPGQQVTGAHDSLPLQRVREKSTGKVWWQKTPGAGGTKHGVMSFLRRRVPTPAPAGVPAIPAGTNPGNADRSVSILVAVQNAITSPLASIEKMYNFISYALGGETDVPLGPEAAVKRVNNPQIVVEQLRPAEGRAGDAKRRQIKDAQTGLAEAKHTGDRYRDGLMTTNATTKFFLWGFLSRELNVAAQEAGFLDAIAGGVNKYIDAAIAGQFDAAMLDDYLKWAKTVFPEGSFGAQAQKNLNQFGELFLLKLSQPVAPEILAEIYTTLPVPTEPMNGLALLHDMIATPDHFSSRKLRRDFHRFATGVGVQNKVLSFVLLVAGRTDVLVLDRVRIDAEYNTGIYGSYNLYSGVSELGPNGKKQRIKGTGLAEIFDGVRGLLFYEMLEDAYSQVLPGVYAELGRPEHASLASYHWETWVIDSGQEVDHGTTSAIVREAAGDPRPYESVVVREGQYDKFAYGALYQYKDGKPLILYPLQEGGRTDYVEMTLPQWRAFLFELQRQQNRANITGERVVPNGFSIEQAARVTDEFRDPVTGEPLAQPQPWYDDERVSWRALDILARRHGTAHERRAVTPEDETAGAHGARRAHRGIRGTRTPEPTPGELVQSEATAAYPDEDLPEKLTQKMVEWYGDEADYTVHGVPTIADRVRAIARGARGSLYIIGKKVTGSVQLAKLMRAFRDPRFEHGHVLLLNDAGRIVYHSIDTSGSVDQVTGRRGRFQHIVATAKRLGVTRVVLVHNHPSGNTQASSADLLFHENWSRRLAQEGLSLEMDLILNHTEVGVVELNNRMRPSRYEPTGRKLKVAPPKGQEQDWTQQPLNVATHTTSAIARIVTGTVTRDAEGNWVHGRPQAPGFGQVFIVFLDARNQILAVGPSDARSLTRSPERLSWLDDSMTQLGASKIAILTNNEASPGSYRSISMAMDGFIARYNRRVLDVADVSETGMVRASARVRGHMTNDVFQQVLPAIASTEMEIQAEGGEAFTAEEGDGSAPPDPRVADLQSLDPVTRVVAALKIGAGKEKKTRDEIALALLAAQSPDVLAALHATAPHGRGTYRSEQVLKAIRPALAKHTDAVISPEEILRQLSRSLNVPILATGKRWGSLRAAGAQGAYRQGSRVVRIASAGDIETAGHEIGHFVHELVHGIAKNNQLDVSGIDPAHRAELVKLVTKSSGVFVTKQSGAKVREGVAEFFRRYITNPEDAQLRASGYYDFVTQELEAKHPAVYRALMQARSQFELWRTGTDTARILAKIHSAAEVDPGNPNRTPWDRFMEQIVNDLHYVKKIEDRLLGKDAPPEARVTARAALLRGAGGAADLWIRNGQYDWRSRQKIGDSLFTILKPIFEGGSRDLFTAYIVARRMRYLIRQKDKDVGMDIGTVERVIAQTETEQFIAAFDQLTQYNLNLLNMLRDSGVLAENDYLEIIKDPEAVANYVPFHRVKEKGANARGREQGLFLSKAVVKRFGGGTADIVDPLESIVKNTYAFTHAAMQQQVNSAFVDLMSQEGAGVFGNIITPKSEKTDVNVAEIWDQLDAEMGGALGTMPDELKKVYLRIFRPGDFFGTANVISVLQANEVTGKSERIWYEVTDNDLYKAVTGMNRDDLKLWQRLASYPSAWRRAGATLSPEFLIRNPIRDQMSAWINSEYGYVPWYDLGRGMLALFRQGDMYERWKASGGEYSTLVDLDRKGLQRKLSELEPSGPMSAGKAAMFVPNVVKNIYHALQALSALMENGTRMGEFIRAFETEISRGTVSEVAMARAGNAARRITTDFGQHGSKTKALRAVATFWNAGLQGETRTIEAFKKDPVRASLIAFGAITLPSLFFLAANWDDEEYWEIPQWQRDLFWLMKVPDFVPDFLQQTEESGAAGQWFKPFISSKEGVWLRLPKPFGLGQVFGSIPERIAEWVRHDDPHAFAETMKNLVPLSPWASNPLFGGVPDIALVQPFFDNATNWSRFLQRPVVPPSAEGVPKTEQYGPRTSEVAKALSQFFAKTKTEKYIPFVGEQIQSPYKLDNLLRSWTAGLGAYGVAVVDPALRATGLAREQPDRMGPKAAKTLADIAGVKALVARSPSWGSESIARFYERYSEVKQAHDLVQKYERSNQPRAAALAARRYQQDLIEYSRLAPIASAIAQLREQSTLADMGPMSPVDKAERIDAHGRLAAELAARATGRPFRVAKIRQHSFTRATVPVE